MFVKPVVGMHVNGYVVCEAGVCGLVIEVVMCSLCLGGVVVVIEVSSVKWKFR